MPSIYELVPTALSNHCSEVPIVLSPVGYYPTPFEPKPMFRFQDGGFRELRRDDLAYVGGSGVLAVQVEEGVRNHDAVPSRYCPPVHIRPCC